MVNSFKKKEDVAGFSCFDITFTSGRFLFVALSKAKYDKVANSLAPTSTRKTSPALAVTMPITVSPFCATYCKRQKLKMWLLIWYSHILNGLAMHSLKWWWYEIIMSNNIFTPLLHSDRESLRHKLINIPWWFFVSLSKYFFLIKTLNFHN